MKEIFWYCSDNCSYPGPWRNALTRCITCEHDRCRYCVEEWYFIRDSAELPESTNGGNSETNLLFKQSEATVLPVPVPAEDRQSTVASKRDSANDSETALAESTESTITSDGARSFVLGDESEGDSSENSARVRTLSNALASSMLKSFITRRFRRRSPNDETASHQSQEQQFSHASFQSSASAPSDVRQTQKRPFRSSRDYEDPDENREGDRGKRPYRPGESQSTGGRLLACPYYRFDVNRYSERNTRELCYRGCSSVCIRNISRLKFHLYRVHRRPEYYCGGCYDIFDNQNQLDGHAQQRPACKVVEEPKFQEKMDRDQTILIKRRSVRKEAQTEWVNIYKILFPRADPPPSSFAYADGDSSEAVQEALSHFEAEGPNLLSTLVQEHMHDHAALDEHTRTILTDALELAGTRLVSLLRLRFHRFDPARATADYTPGIDAHVAAGHALGGGDSATQELPAIGDTLDLSDLDFDVSFDQWFNPEYLE